MRGEIRLVPRSFHGMHIVVVASPISCLVLLPSILHRMHLLRHHHLAWRQSHHWPCHRRSLHWMWHHWWSHYWPCHRRSLHWMWHHWWSHSLKHWWPIHWRAHVRWSSHVVWMSLRWRASHNWRSHLRRSHITLLLLTFLLLLRYVNFHFFTWRISISI